MKSSYTNKKNRIAVGRGSTAIYLALKGESLQQVKVLVPANICYAAVFPILLSGNIPVFCDVDANTGNMRFEDINNAWEDGIAAAVIPHMYGNPVECLPEIVDFLHSRKVMVIEDCASALGAEVGGVLVGSLGDYAVYSFGHSKTIDIGNGGVLATDLSLDKIASLYGTLPKYTDDVGKDCDFFSKLYRAIRNDPQQGWSTYIYKALSEKAAGMFLYRMDSGFENKLEESVTEFKQVVDRRRTEVDVYRRLIRFNKNCREYKFAEGSSPWRFNVMVEPNIRQELIAYLLNKNVPVSDWYPTVTDIFSENKEFPGARYMEERILNFPLMTNKVEIERICSIVNSFFEG